MCEEGKTHFLNEVTEHKDILSWREKEKASPRPPQRQLLVPVKRCSKQNSVYREGISGSYKKEWIWWGTEITSDQVAQSLKSSAG